MVSLNLLKRRNDRDRVVGDKTRYVLMLGALKKSCAQHVGRPRGNRLRFPVVIEIRTICLLSLCTIAHRSLVDRFARQRKSVLSWNSLSWSGS